MERGDRKMEDRGEKERGVITQKDRGEEKV